MDDVILTTGALTTGAIGLIWWYIKVKISNHMKWVESVKERLITLKESIDLAHSDNDRQREQIEDLKQDIRSLRK